MDSEFWVRESIRDRIVEDDYEVGDQLGRYRDIFHFIIYSIIILLLLFCFLAEFQASFRHASIV